MTLRRKLMLPVLLVALAALAGGLAATLAGPDTPGGAEASSSRQVDFHFLPPTGADNTTSTLTCGWHSVCVEFLTNADGTQRRVDGGERPKYGLDFSNAADDKLYLRGYAYDSSASSTNPTEPVTVTVENKPDGFPYYYRSTGNRERTNPCKTVQALFVGAGESGDWSIRGKYRISHAEQSGNSTVRLQFSNENAPYGRLNGGVEIGTTIDETEENEDRGCPIDGEHAHVERSYDQKIDSTWQANPYWTDNIDYPTWRTTYKEGKGQRAWPNTAISSWMFQLRIFPATANPPDSGSSTVNITKRAQAKSARQTPTTTPRTMRGMRCLPERRALLTRPPRWPQPRTKRKRWLPDRRAVPADLVRPPMHRSLPRTPCPEERPASATGRPRCPVASGRTTYRRSSLKGRLQPGQGQEPRLWPTGGMLPTTYPTWFRWAGAASPV